MLQQLLPLFCVSVAAPVVDAASGDEPAVGVERRAPDVDVAQPEAHAESSPRASPDEGSRDEGGPRPPAAESSGAVGTADEISDFVVAVLPLTLRSENAGLRVHLEEQLDRGLERAGLTLASRERVAAIAGDGCSLACGQKLEAELGVTHLLTLEVHEEDDDYELEVVLVDFATGASQAFNDRCETCSVRDAGARLSGLVGQTRDIFRAEAKKRPVLHIDSTPRNALVYLDGRHVGSTPLDWPAKPGTVRVKVAMSGYEDHEQDATLVRGHELSVDVDLVPTKKRELGRKLAFAALGVGAPLIGVGVTFLALDGRYTECPAGDVGDPRTRCMSQYSSSLQGATLLAGGLALEIAGITVLALTRERRRQRAVTVVPALNGIALRGRF